MANYRTTFKSIPVNPSTPSGQLGIAVSRSGAVVLDENFFIDENFTAKSTPEMSKFLVADVTGTIVFEYFDGKFGFINSAIVGFWYPISARKVVTNHTFDNGGLKTTTAAGISWYGGW